MGTTVSSHRTSDLIFVAIDRSAYMPGDVVSGFVQVSLKEPLEIKGMPLRLLLSSVWRGGQRCFLRRQMQGLILRCGSWSMVLRCVRL
jgi:hypothetical protein